MPGTRVEEAEQKCYRGYPRYPAKLRNLKKTDFELVYRDIIKRLFNPHIYVPDVTFTGFSFINLVLIQAFDEG